MSANNKASVQGVVMRCTLVVGFFLGMLLVACGRAPQPIDGLWGAPIQTSTPLSPTIMPPALKVAPTIIITSETADADPNDEALFILNIIVEDRYGFLQAALVTITWEDNPTPFVVGPTADIKVPIQASSSPFLLKVEKDGYLTVYQPFDVTLNADMQYEWTVTLLAAGEAA